jgi:hypothetical protein
MYIGYIIMQMGHFMAEETILMLPGETGFCLIFAHQIKRATHHLSNQRGGARD